jgi:hypothetical protein
VRRVCIYADNDADAEFAGQASAYILAQRLVREAKKAGIHRAVEVFVPRQAGTDWADIWLASLAKDSARRRLSGVAAMPPPLSVCPVRAQRQRFPKWQLPGHAELQRR